MSPETLVEAKESVHLPSIQEGFLKVELRVLNDGTEVSAASPPTR